MVLLRDYETAVEQAAAEPDNKKLQKHLLDLQQQMDAIPSDDYLADMPDYINDADSSGFA